MSSLFKEVSTERDLFGTCDYLRTYDLGMPRDASHQLCVMLDKLELITINDKAEIVRYWRIHETDYNLRAKTPIKTLDDARIAVQNIDDGRIGWYNGPEYHPAWHKEIPV